MAVLPTDTVPGLAVAAAEMALAAGHGVTLEADAELAPLAWFFGEDQGRYLVACKPEDAARITETAMATQLAVRKVGETGGDVIRLGHSSVPLADLREAHATGFARMAMQQYQ